MNYVSWGDAARFANWLTHNKPSGLQDASTTEDGAYRLNGATSGGDLAAVTRRADAVYAGLAPRVKKLFRTKQEFEGRTAWSLVFDAEGALS